MKYDFPKQDGITGTKLVFTLHPDGAMFLWHERKTTGSDQAMAATFGDDDAEQNKETWSAFKMLRYF